MQFSNDVVQAMNVWSKHAEDMRKVMAPMNEMIRQIQRNEDFAQTTAAVREAVRGLSGLGGQIGQQMIPVSKALAEVGQNVGSLMIQHQSSIEAAGLAISEGMNRYYSLIKPVTETLASYMAQNTALYWNDNVLATESVMVEKMAAYANTMPVSIDDTDNEPVTISDLLAEIRRNNTEISELRAESRTEAAKNKRLTIIIFLLGLLLPKLLFGEIEVSKSIDEVQQFRIEMFEMIERYYHDLTELENQGEIDPEEWVEGSSSV